MFHLLNVSTNILLSLLISTYHIILSFDQIENSKCCLPVFVCQEHLLAPFLNQPGHLGLTAVVVVEDYSSTTLVCSCAQHDVCPQKLLPKYRLCLQAVHGGVSLQEGCDMGSCKSDI